MVKMEVKESEISEPTKVETDREVGAPGEGPEDVQGPERFRLPAEVPGGKSEPDVRDLRSGICGTILRFREGMTQGSLS